MACPRRAAAGAREVKTLICRRCQKAKVTDCYRPSDLKRKKPVCRMCQHAKDVKYSNKAAV
jgi:hypothetical protein